MIPKQELMDLSREFSLDVRIVEKDYVLGCLLAGIANDSNLFNKWIFKGGTCLKKCYFETYHFSEAPLKEKINLLWKPPSMIQAWHIQAPFELIRVGPLVDWNLLISKKI